MKEKEYCSDAAVELLLDMLAGWGAVMLSTTKNGWCCHVVNSKGCINRHIHAESTRDALAKMYDALNSADYLDEKPEAEE